jgi:tetratricopeptide (TPR) repeat protein
VRSANVMSASSFWLCLPPRFKTNELAKEQAAAAQAAGSPSSSLEPGGQQQLRWWQASGYLAAAHLALGMRLPAAAAALLDLAAREEAQGHLAQGPARPLLQAQLLLLQGDAAGALQLLEPLLQDVAPSRPPGGGGSMALDALATAADCYLATGSPEQARQHYCRAFKGAQAAHGAQQLVLLRAGGCSLQPPRWPRLADCNAVRGGGQHQGRPAAVVWEFERLLRVTLALGQLYSGSGDQPAALATFLAAAEVQPCASVWLGAGVACLESGDLDGADMALVAANRCDTGRPAVWGQLALLAARSGRMQEAKQVGLGGALAAPRWAHHPGAN